eukprot:TRINITY_DN889_c0_g1_i2.p1 TRINITY_DN889_c0_g1~~TRINITY_DN889_c0_g1_i2.p1  ORF type:complete len:162 (+),score=15.34 TRINITY_DN889_c0_g1_i2:293-778(+)
MFQRYFNENHAKVILILLLSSSHVESLLILSSGIFGISVFLAPWQPGTEGYLVRAGVFGNLLEDIPQLTIQSYILSVAHCSNFTTITEISLATSFIALLFGLTKRITFYLLKKGETRAELEDPTLRASRHGNPLRKDISSPDMDRREIANRAPGVEMGQQV